MQIAPQSPVSSRRFATIGAIWQKNRTDEMNWHEAKEYCDNLTLAGYQNWRLPEIEELNFFKEIKNLIPDGFTNLVKEFVFNLPISLISNDS